jgi:predicted metal-dependent TIM-barrel fold hydrolase
MQLAFLDSWIIPAQSDTKDLENLSFFGTNEAIIAASLEPTTDLLSRWEKLVTKERERVLRAGITPYIALGLSAELIPKRNWKELVAQLEQLLTQHKLHALGPISLGTLPRHQEALTAQLNLAATHKLPCVIALPTRGKLPAIAAVAALAAQANLPAARLAFLHCNGRALVKARALGAYSIITTHPDYLKARHAVSLIKRQGLDKVMLASGLGMGPCDVLALQKVALALSKDGVSTENIMLATRENSRRFLGLTQPQE